jgi:hypothetical protein
MTDQTGYGRLQLQPDNKNGILATHFQFEMRKISNVTYFCQSVALPGLRLRSTEQLTPFNNIPRPGGALNPDNLSISFMVDENLKNWLEIYEWMRQCTNQADFDTYEGPDKHLNSEGVLFIHDSNNQPRFRINFEGLFPTSLGGLNFKTGSQGSEFQYSQVTFEYTLYRITPLYAS